MQKGIFVAIVLLLALSSCKKETLISEINLTVSKSKILNDNSDDILALVTDQNGNNVTGKVDLVLDDVALMSNIIQSRLPGTYTLYAEYKDIKSNTIQITVVEDMGFEYKKIVLLEQFTATWCPWCPRAISQIEAINAIDNNTSHIAYHLNDEFTYSLNSSLAEHSGVGGIPDVIVDRAFSWDGNSSDITSRHNPVRAGIELEVSDISADAFSIEVSVRFGKVFADDIYLSVYLIEDGLIADQKSNYNYDSNSQWYQMGETIPDLEHRNVMLATITNLLGDKVPANKIDIGSLYELTYTVSAPANIGPGTPWITEASQAKIIAFLTFGSGPMFGEVINSITCDLGSTAENELFD